MAKPGFVVDIPVNVSERLPWLEKVKFGLHCAQIVLIFMTICVIAPLIADEVKAYGGSSPGPNFTIVVCVFTFTAPPLLLYFPWAYEKQNKFKRLGKFALKPRTNLIFAGFNTIVWGAAGIAMTVHSNNSANCADPTMCNLGRAGAAFTWLTCLTWLGCLICTTIVFWTEKQQVQQNIKQNRQDRMEALEAQELDDQPGNDYHRQKYEMDEDDIGGMRPQSFEQARPLQSPAFDSYQQQHQQHQPPPPQHHQQYEASPFDDPAYYQPPAPEPSAPYAPYDPHQGGSGFAMPDHARYTPEPRH
ncbi:hypothetical protein BC940DRAFT_306042 [Gongronella butleri]|nr:hypothetical protein BC940DRAFT_306042 [Gongronella butleri]